MMRQDTYQEELNNWKLLTRWGVTIIVALGLLVAMIGGVITGCDKVDTALTKRGVEKAENAAEAALFRLCSKRFASGTLDARCLAFIAPSPDYLVDTP